MARRPKTVPDAAKALQEILHTIISDVTNDISPWQRRTATRLLARVEDLIGPVDG